MSLRIECTTADITPANAAQVLRDAALAVQSQPHQTRSVPFVSPILRTSAGKNILGSSGGAE
jgi:hypothetical protein